MRLDGGRRLGGDGQGGGEARAAGAPDGNRDEVGGVSAAWTGVAAIAGGAVVVGAGRLAFTLAKRKSRQLAERRRQQRAQSVRDEAFPVAVTVTGVALLLAWLFRDGAK